LCAVNKLALENAFILKMHENDNDIFSNASSIASRKTSNFIKIKFL